MMGAAKHVSELERHKCFEIREQNNKKQVKRYHQNPKARLEEHTETIYDQTD